MQSNDEPIRLNEAGPYGELMDRPNPHGFLIVTVPPFEQMLPFLERMAGRAFTPAEIEAERRRSPAIALTQAGMARLNATREKREMGRLKPRGRPRLKR